MDPGGKIVVGLPARSTELFERVGDVVAVGFVEILTQGGDFAGGFVDGEFACCFVLQLGQQLFEALELIARPIHLGRCVFVRVGVGTQPFAEGADFVVGVICSYTCPGAFVRQAVTPVLVARIEVALARSPAAMSRIDWTLTFLSSPTDSDIKNPRRRGC
ncbi:Uncharacterised protein [Mycobacteroides abscessus]|nr:Uncharacterised protein [Mycobacteroides abscessus]